VKTDAIGLAALTLVSVAWAIFGFSFLFRKKNPRVLETGRSSVSKWGIVVQAVGFAMIWSFPRPQWWPFNSSTAGESALATLAVVLACASCLLCLLAVRRLGKHWTCQARVIEGHELMTQGPYALVRNPIYLGIFGLMIASGLVFSRWWTFLGAVVLFLAGNHIRTRAEEKLLRETFGPVFDDYARRVPAFLPRVF
jgi:protein-S-isoprenylcysteine O-methyltransferase Ste14